MADSLGEWFKNFRQGLKQNSFVNLVWLINFLPILAGFPFLSKKFKVLFWIIHTVLAFYVYILGSVVYQMHYADGFVDYINSFFNVSVFVIIFNNSWWLLYKRNDLNDILKLARTNDDLVVETGRLLDVYQRLLRRIKIVVIMCYTFHFVNDIIIFIPSRTIGIDNYSVVSCVGLEPLTDSPNREVCKGILALQELTAIVVVAGYDVTLLFLFSHTTTIFQMLFEDMASFTNIAECGEDSGEDYSIIEDRLKNLIIRHSLALHTVHKLKAVYSTVVGIGFGIDAICLCLFFVLPLEVCLNFAPVVYYCLFKFFLYCFYGQRLTTASEKFEIAVYSCGWENFRVKERKHVLLMLKQAQEPVIVYAANVIPIRIYTFANTMQSIYKFVTVFKL